MLRKMLFACCLMGLTVTFAAGCKDEAKKSDAKKADKPAASAPATSDAGKRPVAPPHAPGNS